MPLLRVRPGVRFMCHADGVCCSDVHALGPIREAELVPLRRLAADVAVREPAVSGWGLRVQDGACMFLREDHLCRVHAELGLPAKPATCRRYPFNLVGTPDGLRVVTPHRCPCRTMGPRPLLDVQTVAAEILIEGAALEVDHQVGGEVRLTRQRRLPFSQWSLHEDHLRARLFAEPPERVLQAKPFPELRASTWANVAAELTRSQDGSAFDVAKCWLGDAIGVVTGGRPWPQRTRPWSRFFVAGERRTSVRQDADEMIADWMADELWSLQWTQFGTFARGRRDLATRLALVRALCQRLGDEGLRIDRAAAEALLIVDVVTHAQHWYDVVRAFVEPDE